MNSSQRSPNAGTRVTMKPRIAIREKPHRFQLSPLREVPAAAHTPMNRAHIPTRTVLRDKTNNALRALAQNTPRTESGDVRTPFMKPAARPNPTRIRANSVNKTPVSQTRSIALRHVSSPHALNNHTRSKTSPSPSRVKSIQRASAQTPKLPSHRLASNRRDTCSPSYNIAFVGLSKQTPAAAKHDVRGAALIAKAAQVLQPPVIIPPKLPASRKAFLQRQVRSALPNVAHVDNSVSSDAAAFGSPVSALRRSVDLARTPGAFGHTWKAVSIDTPTKLPQTPCRIPRSRRNLSLESALNFPVALDDGTVRRAFDLEQDTPGREGEGATPLRRQSHLQAWSAGVRPTTPSMHSQSSDSILDLVNKRASTTSFAAGGAVVDDFLARLKNGVEGKLTRPGFKAESAKPSGQESETQADSKPPSSPPSQFKTKYASIAATRADSSVTQVGNTPLKAEARRSVKRHAIYTRSLHMPSFRGFNTGEEPHQVLRQRGRSGTTGQTFSSSQRQKKQMSPDARDLYEHSKAGKAANIVDRSLLLEPFSLDSAMGSQSSLSSMYSQTSIANTLFHVSAPLGVSHRSAYSLDSISCVTDLSHSVSGKLSTLGSFAGSADDLRGQLRSTTLDQDPCLPDPVIQRSDGTPSLGSVETTESEEESLETDVFGTPTIPQSKASQPVDSGRSRMTLASPPLSIAIVPPSESARDLSYDDALRSPPVGSGFLRPCGNQLGNHLARPFVPRPRRMSSLNVQVKICPPAAQYAAKAGAKVIGHHPIIAELLEEVDRDLLAWMKMQVDATILEYGVAF